MGKQVTVFQHIKNVLLVEDDLPLAHGLQLALQRAGLTVHHVTNGRLALEWLKKNLVELVITDIFMDEMDGVEMLPKLKKAHPAIKIIASSGGSRMVNVDFLPVAKALGADRILPKPAKIETLLETIRELDAGTRA
jgi:DNA-binding response OmpR family regulator